MFQETRRPKHIVIRAVKTQRH